MIVLNGIKIMKDKKENLSYRYFRSGILGATLGGIGLLAHVIRPFDNVSYTLCYLFFMAGLLCFGIGALQKNKKIQNK
jgi:hypothetical protein